jgi:DNA polymerase
MTSVEKTSLARFLDLAADSLHNGYRSPMREYQFTDDAAETVQSLPIQAPSPAAPSALPQGGSLERIAGEVNACRACPLCEGRANAVPGEGVAHPRVLVIGEGPGAEEDATGRPFAGKAGQLLDKMLASIRLSRETNCFIANVVKCRPPGNRDPEPDEIAACMPFLERQICALRPAFILCAGRVASQALLKTEEPIGRLRGAFNEVCFDSLSIPLLATYHPSALLRNEELKRPAWEDLKLLREKLQETTAGGGQA